MIQLQKYYTTPQPFFLLSTSLGLSSKALCVGLWNSECPPASVTMAYLGLSLSPNSILNYWLPKILLQPERPQSTIVTINFYIVAPTSNQPQHLEEHFNSFTSISALSPTLYHPAQGLHHSSVTALNTPSKSPVFPLIIPSFPLKQRTVHSFPLSLVQCT